MRLTGRADMTEERLTVHEAVLQAGQGRVRAKGALQLREARAYAVSAQLERLNPADFGDFPAARINASAEIEGSLHPQWEARTRYALTQSVWRGYRLTGGGRLVLSQDRAREVDARLALGRNALHLEGAFGGTRDALRFSLRAPALAALGETWGGTAEAQGTISGSRTHPAIDATLNARQVRIPGGLGIAALTLQADVAASADPQLRVRASGRGLQVAGDTVESVDLAIDGPRSAHAIALQVRRGALDLHASARGGLTPAWDKWLGRIESLENRGAESFRLEEPAALSVSRAALALGPSRVSWAGGRISIEDTVYTSERIQSSGTATGLPMRKLLESTEIDLGLENSIVLGARWKVEAADRVDGRIEIFRESGDLTARIDEERVVLGIQQLALDVEVVRNRAQANATFASPTAGTLAARGETTLSRRDGFWGVAGTAPANLDVEARLDSVRALAAAFTRDVVIDGRMQARVTARGTVAAPELRGELTGTSIQVEQVATGVFLRDGTLEAEFTPDAVRLRSFRIRAGEGEFTGAGEYRFKGQRLALDWAARQLAALQMPDLLLVVSGSGTVVAEDGRIALAGTVRADKGRVELREIGTAALGEDVVVVGRESKPTVAGRVLRSKLDVNVDLGKDFGVSGRGLEARLTGRLRLHNEHDAPLRADGAIQVVKGTYEAYGRTLAIEDGTLLFAGSPSNPALDILALRRNQQVQAGVRVTGTANRPEVRLVSIPEVPDMDKLAWLTLGRPLNPGNQSDTETLQRYAAAMAATLGTGSFQAQIARAVGLDEIVVLPGTDPASDGGIVQIGKRIGNRIYVVLEQRLSTAQNVLRVNYQLARDWSLRLESGETDAVDLFYSLSFD